MDKLTIEFETVVLNELKRWWNYNCQNFKWTSSGITPPNFRITEAESHWGQWSPETREMSFSGYLVSKRPWNEVLEVLKHEMAHQYVSEVLHINNEQPHGPSFYNVCKTYRIDAAVRGTPGADKVTATNHIVEKIRHLLDLATNKAAMPGEAEAAAEAAHNMMLKYNIALQEKQEAQDYTVMYLGGVTGRIQGYMSEMANLLSKYYFVEIIWVSAYDPRNKKRGHELEISGTKDNVAVAEYVYDFLSRSAVEAWDKKLADPAFKLELHKEFAKSFGWSTSVPQSIQGFTTSARSNFLVGFIRGFSDQLRQADIKEQTAGLVLARDPALEEFFKERHPHIRQLNGGGARRNTNMQRQGFQEGKSLRIPAAAVANKQFVPLLKK